MPGGSGAHTIPFVNLIAEIQPGGGVPLDQLKITLKWSKPPIWRRVVMRGDMPLHRLHEVIQIAMGWMGGHMHQFITRKGFAATYYGTPNPGFADMGQEMLNEREFTVADLAPAAKRKFIYEYDFGDSWEHEIVVEKILPPDPAFRHPVCLAGANACPPEDCGGISGYYDLLEILADAKHPEHENMKEWIGGEFDAEAFSLEGVNVVFKQIKA